jgi:hypothetical protein
LWSTQASEDLVESVAAERFLIADGHHRYHMALRYQEERGEAGTGP